MKIYHSSKSFPPSLVRPIVALGNFDGVHLAHQKMFKLARQVAKKIQGCTVAYTFEPHPVKILAKESAPLLLNTLQQKIELLAEEGLHAVIVEPFDLNFAHLQGKEWFEKVLVKNIRAAGVVAGYDFTFGTHRSGTVETLEQLCLQHGLQCQILEAQLLGETLISSTQIRAFITRGDVAHANALLGKAYFIDGKVVQGAGRGASLGIRTANLKIENELLPMAGVYACRAEVENRSYRAVANIGMNPTFGGETMGVEAHLLKFNRNIYGRSLRLHFLERIREEKTFPSPKKLVEQIHQDIAKAGKIFSRKNKKN